MNFSDELMLFLGQLHQDFHLEDDVTEAFMSILAGFGRARSQMLASFLDRFLSQPYDVSDLERQWLKSRAEFRLENPEEIPQFLAMVRDVAKSARVTSSPVP